MLGVPFESIRCFSLEPTFVAMANEDNACNEDQSYKIQMLPLLHGGSL
jgi:hypothetical protein